MKKLLTFFTLLTLFFIVGRAETVTYSMTPDTASTGLDNTSYITTMTPFTINGVSWKMNQWNPTTLQVRTNQSSAASEFRFYNTSAFPGKITKVVITFKALTVSDASKLMFLGGTSEVTAITGGTAGTWDANNLTLTWIPAANTDFTYFAFYQNGKAASGTNYLAEADAIVVTYETSYTPIPKLYLAGTFNNWDTTADEMTLGADGKYTITMALPAEGRVKFVDDNEHWYGAPAAAGTYYWLTQNQVGETITIGTGSGYEDIYFPVAGEWTFSVDLENEEVIITGDWPGTYETVTIPYEETLVSSQGKFKIENVSLGGLTAVWKTSSYGMTANGNNCTSDVESWFVSPLIDASEVTGVNLTFDEQLRYFADQDDADAEATLWVREGANGTWTQVTIPTHTLVNSNDFHNAGDIDMSAYAGKVFQLGFKYMADTISPGRWELKNLNVTAAAVVNPTAATVAAIKALEDSTTFDFTGTNLVVTAQKNSYMYAQDATGGILIYGSVGQTYKKGQIIPAGFTGKKVMYYGAPQIIELSGFQAATDSVEVPVKEFAEADFALDNFGIYGVVRGATVNGNKITFGGKNYATYTTFATVPGNTSGKTYDVYGIMSWRDSVQFLPTEYVELNPETPVPGDQYELVTSASQIAAGKEYVLVYSSDAKTAAMANASGNIRTAAFMGEREFTLADGVVTLMSTTSVTPFTLEASETEGTFFNIKIDGDKYLSWSSGNSVVTGDTKGDVTVALNDKGNAVIKYEGEDRYLQYNAGSPRFCFYTGTQQYPQLYVKIEPVTNHAEPVITVHPEKDTYFVGEEVTVIFSSEETGVNIGYDIENSETFPTSYHPITNGDSITVTADEPKTVTVRAFAYGYEEGDVLGNSEVVTKEIVFVAAPTAGDSYELVTDESQIVAGGEYVLANTNGDVTAAMAGDEPNHNYRMSATNGPTEFTVDKDVITLMSTTTVTPFVLETADTEGFFNIKIDGDKYLYWGGGNYVYTDTIKGEVSITLDKGDAVIKYNVKTEDRYLQYNANAPRFAFYKNTQKNAKLYVKVAAPAVKLGDANCDEKVDVNDVTAVINYILKKNPNPFSYDNANVNGDDKVDVMDVTLIIDMILHPNNY
jgi:hypothetical protein